MLRRNPTRIELKLDDISEYTDMRESEMKKEKEKTMSQGLPASMNMGVKSKQEVQDRIGYVPHPRSNN